MFGKLMKKKESDSARPVKLPKPRDILEPVGRALVIRHNQNPDWVWSLKCVVLPDPRDPQREHFRVYDPQACRERGLTVKAYPDLDAHPELVAYHGWVDKKSRAMELIDSREGRGEAL